MDSILLFIAYIGVVLSIIVILICLAWFAESALDIWYERKDKRARR